MRSPVDNRLQGQGFEELFLSEAKFRGLYARKNHLSAKYGWNGRLKPLKSDLDYLIIDPSTGRVGLFDCKSFQRDHFTYSDLEQHQIDQAVLFNEYKVAAGFVVHFGATGSVVFYTGTEIHTDGPGKRFDERSGLRLGRLWDFDLRPIMRSSAASEVKVRRKPKKQRSKRDECEVDLGHA